jgi:hypothetical protein
MVDVADVGRHHIAVVPGDSVALDDLGCIAGQRGDVGELTRRRSDTDHDAEREAEAAWIDVGVVAADDAGGLQALDPLRDRRRGEADASPEFGERHPRITLELRQQTQIRRVEKLIFGGRPALL